MISKTDGEVAGWTVVGNKKAEKFAASTAKKALVSTSTRKGQASTPTRDDSSVYTGFRSIHPAILHNLPREVRIAYDDRNARWAKLRRAEKENPEQESLEKLKEWRIREENH